MKFTKRLSNAWKMVFNKSDRQTIELNNLYKFLGINPDEDEKVLSEATYFACLKVLSEALGKLPLAKGLFILSHQRLERTRF